MVERELQQLRAAAQPAEQGDLCDARPDDTAAVRVAKARALVERCGEGAVLVDAVRVKVVERDPRARIERVPAEVGLPRREGREGDKPLQPALTPRAELVADERVVRVEAIEDVLEHERLRLGGRGGQREPARHRVVPLGRAPRRLVAEEQQLRQLRLPLVPISQVDEAGGGEEARVVDILHQLEVVARLAQRLRPRPLGEHPLIPPTELHRHARPEPDLETLHSRQWRTAGPVAAG
jgi:hypothetical protein